MVDFSDPRTITWLHTPAKEEEEESNLFLSPHRARPMRSCRLNNLLSSTTSVSKAPNPIKRIRFSTAEIKILRKSLEAGANAKDLVLHTSLAQDFSIRRYCDTERVTRWFQNNAITVPTAAAIPVTSVPSKNTRMLSPPRLEPCTRSKTRTKTPIKENQPQQSPSKTPLDSSYCTSLWDLPSPPSAEPSPEPKKKTSIQNKKTRKKSLASKTDSNKGIKSKPPRKKLKSKPAKASNAIISKRVHNKSKTNSKEIFDFTNSPKAPPSSKKSSNETKQTHGVQSSVVKAQTRYQPLVMMSSESPTTPKRNHGSANENYHRFRESQCRTRKEEFNFYTTREKNKEISKAWITYKNKHGKVYPAANTLVEPVAKVTEVEEPIEAESAEEEAIRRPGTKPQVIKVTKRHRPQQGRKTKDALPVNMLDSCKLKVSYHPVTPNQPLHSPGVIANAHALVVPESKHEAVVPWGAGTQTQGLGLGAQLLWLTQLKYAGELSPREFQAAKMMLLAPGLNAAE